jgi:hypothetical protein
VSAEPLVLTPILSADPTAAALTVEPLAAPLEAAWDRYVRAAPDATFFHQLGWRWLVERCFGHRAHYLVSSR